MEEIEEKLMELWDLLQTIPEDCKGEGNSVNRYRYLKIKRAITDLIKK